PPTRPSTDAKLSQKAMQRHLLQRTATRYSPTKCSEPTGSTSAERWPLSAIATLRLAVASGASGRPGAPARRRRGRTRGWRTAAAMAGRGGLGRRGTTRSRPVSETQGKLTHDERGQDRRTVVVHGDDGVGSRTGRVGPRNLARAVGAAEGDDAQ